MFSAKFIKDALERAISTVAQAYVASAVVLGGVFDYTAFKVALGAGILSLFKSVAATKVGDKESASIV